MNLYAGNMLLHYTDLPIRVVIPAKAGIQERGGRVDSRSPLPRGQVYTCESRCGNDKVTEYQRFFL